MGKTREGFQWTPASGLQAGLPCDGVVEPSSYNRDATEVFDVLVIGAGYAGLTAARDLTTANLKVMLLDARDRIGGRTWTSNIEGYNFEMGGTWVHWQQPHVYREISRYNMKDELVHCPDYTRKKNYLSFVTTGGRKNTSHEEELELFSRAIGKFVNVDGNRGKTIMPFPFNMYWNPEILQYTSLSVADRIEQIKDDLSEDEWYAIEALVLVCSGGTRENSAFLDFLRWWAAGGYDMETLMDCVLVFKLKSGQSAFARRFFDEARSTENLSYAFNMPVEKVDSSDSNLVRVRTRNGQTFSAKRVICTVPLNVLPKVHFTPSLDHMKMEAAMLKHINQCVKVHAEIKDEEMRSWSGITYPHNKLLLGSADGMTPKGNVDVVFFGCSQNHIHPDEDVDGVLIAIKEFAPDDMETEKLIFHNWSKDEFAEGAWVWYRPGMEVNYLEALRRRQGPVLFANSDWAEGGWRSFIDGAIQEGTTAALTVKNELLDNVQATTKSGGVKL